MGVIGSVLTDLGSAWFSSYSPWFSLTEVKLKLNILFLVAGLLDL